MLLRNTIHTQDFVVGTKTPKQYHIYRHTAICNSECHKCQRSRMLQFYYKVRSYQT
jgi:hypothetical protein